MTIEFLTNGIYPFAIGGMQKHSFYQIVYLARRNIYVNVYHPHENLDEEIINFIGPAEMLYLNFKYIEYRDTVKVPGHYILSGYLYSRRIYNNLPNEINIIYSQGLAGLYLVSRHLKNRLIISNLHGLEMYQRNIGILNYLQNCMLRVPFNMLIRRSNFVVSLGGELTDKLAQIRKSNKGILLIPNAIDDNWTNKTHDRKKNGVIKFCFVGRNERRKGIIELCEAIQRLMSVGCFFEFHFIGLDNCDVDYVFDQNIFFYGVVKKESIIKDLLDQADVLVCPSYSEGMPTVILEAMARECAIVSTNVGAVADLVNESNGVLVKPGCVDDLFAALLHILEMNAETLESLQKASHRKVKEGYIWSATTQKLLDFLDNVV